jgi:hypothetical protein
MIATATNVMNEVKSIGLWRWYINITITILDIIYRLVFYLKHGLSETGFCLPLQVAHLSKIHLKIESNIRNLVF